MKGPYAGTTVRPGVLVSSRPCLLSARSSSPSRSPGWPRLRHQAGVGPRSSFAAWTAVGQSSRSGEARSSGTSTASPRSAVTAVSVVGSPRVVKTPFGRAVEFDGKGDGLFLDVNPIAGLQRFTVEALIEPAGDGPAEQRFLHLAEDGSENRAMLETRILPGGTLVSRQLPAPRSRVADARRPRRTHPAGDVARGRARLRRRADVAFRRRRPRCRGRVAFGRSARGGRRNWRAAEQGVVVQGEDRARPRDAGGAAARRGCCACPGKCPSADARRHGRKSPLRSGGTSYGAGLAASRASARPTSGTAPSSTRSWPATTRTPRSSRTATTTT